MAFSWLVYSPLATGDAQAVEARLRAAVDATLAATPGLAKKGGSWGDVTVEDALPNADDVAELSEAYGRPVSDDVLDRLDQCKSALAIERSGAHDLDPLQVSILRWLIAEIGPCLVDWGDMQIVLSEDIATEIDSYSDVGPLGAAAGASAGGSAAAAETPANPDVGLERASETAAAIGAVSEDPFLRRQFGRLLDRYPEWVKKYAKILGERGPLGDAVVAKELGVPVAKMDAQLQKLHDEAVDLADEAED